MECSTHSSANVVTLVNVAQLSRVLQHEKMCVCGASCAYGEVFSLHSLSRARHSLTSVREMF